LIRVPRVARRGTFAAYALTIVTLTHWPSLTVDGPVPRTDLYIHCGAYGPWTLLLIGAAFFGPLLSTRNIVISGIVAASWAVVDELTQGIPGLHRTVSALDLAANVSGAALATGFGLAAARFRSRADSRSPVRADPSRSE
jgi:hypothetical protein